MVETHFGPVAIGGRTVTLVARTRALRLAGRHGQGFAVRARPSHVEVLEGDGNRTVVHVPDVEGMLIATILVVGCAGVVAARILRRSR
jgi:hypothetical protein